MTEIQSLLAQALTELPGGPIATPVGLAAKGARRRVVRRRVTVLASVGAMLAVGGAVVTLTSGARQHATVAGSREPVLLTTCATPAGLSAAPSSRPPLHSAAQVTASVREVVLTEHTGTRTHSFGEARLSLRAGRLVWVVEQLTGTPGSRYFGALWLVPDADLADRTSAACALRRSLDGATLDPPAPTLFILRRPRHAGLEGRVGRGLKLLRGSAAPSSSG